MYTYISTFTTAPSYMFTYYNVHYGALLRVYILQRSASSCMYTYYNVHYSALLGSCILQRPYYNVHITTFITASFCMYTYYNVHYSALLQLLRSGGRFWNMPV